MKYRRLLVLCLLPLLLAGCATVNRQDRTVLQSHNVPDDVYQKMMYGDPLSPGDIVVLSQRAVPPGLIIHYLKVTDGVYRLHKRDVDRLRAQGVNDEVIAYMLSTWRYDGPGPYAGYPPPPPYAYPYYPYGYYDGYYGGPAIIVGGYHGWGGGWGGGGWRGGGWGGRHR
jgi:hypothetical protein